MHNYFSFRFFYFIHNSPITNPQFKKSSKIKTES